MAANYTITKFSGDGKWGFIDKDGKETIPLVYNNTESFKSGKARVTFKGEVFSINMEGEKIEN